MTEDVSWSLSAQKYLQLYRSAIGNHRERRGMAALQD
jgi:glycogen synthase